MDTHYSTPRTFGREAHYAADLLRLRGYTVTGPSHGIGSHLWTTDAPIADVHRYADVAGAPLGQVWQDAEVTILN